jgi:hypothetical protein
MRKVIRVVGQAPLAATVYELEKLRCKLCGEVFTADAPAGVGTEKYDETAASMIALLKYGSRTQVFHLQVRTLQLVTADIKQEEVRDVGNDAFRLLCGTRRSRRQ